MFRCSLFVSGWLVVASSWAVEGGSPRTFVKQLDFLEVGRQAIAAGEPRATADLKRLVGSANGKLAAGPYSVVLSPIVAPSGDPHDYASFAPLYWPNPDTPDGQPWIFRDGKYNPDSEGDYRGMTDLATASQTLSLAYYFTGDERYANKAASLLRTWFLDEETRMNPTMDYALTIPGMGSFFDGVGLGINLPEILDAAGILEMSPAWTEADKAGLQQWMREMIHFSRTSPKGIKEYNSVGNHASSYDLTLGIMAMYADETDEVQETFDRFTQSRIPDSIESDGRQTYEMPRANNSYYHRFGLEVMLEVASLARSFGSPDIFAYETEDGVSIRTAVDFFAPYASGEKEWEFYPGETFALQRRQDFGFLRRVAAYYDSRTYLEAAEQYGFKSIWWEDLAYHPWLIHRPGDFDGDRQLSIADLDLLSAALQSVPGTGVEDLTGDGLIDANDYLFWVTDLYRTTPGDADLDGAFDSSDFVQVFLAGTYEDQIPGNSTWGSGDWNGDGDFTSRDFIVAIPYYESNIANSASASSVPEPTSLAAPLMALTAGILWSRRSRHGRGGDPRVSRAA